jgi:hypothetical protein
VNATAVGKRTLRLHKERTGRILKISGEIFSMRALGRIARMVLLALLLTGTIPPAAGAQVIGTVTGLLGSATVQRTDSSAREPLALSEEIYQVARRLSLLARRG